jgi:hypothetical protein
MKSINKYLPIALFLAFFIFGFNVFMQSRPTHKNQRVYKLVREYSPYYIQKRFGGLEILSKTNKDFKEKPSNENFFKEFEKLERDWGKKHLVLNNDKLIIVDDNNKSLKSIKLKNSDELNFVKNYYGIK